MWNSKHRVRFLLLMAGVLLMASTIAHSQQEPIYTQYMLNTYLINPAVAGYEGATEIALTGREQWVGYGERPRTYTLSFQTRFYADQRSQNVFGTASTTRAVRRGNIQKRGIIGSGSMGIGAMLFNDVNGRFRRTGGVASYAYHITTAKVMYSLGISLSLIQYKVNVLPEDLFDPAVDDPLIRAGSPNSRFAPDIAIGFMASNDSFFAGFSVSSLLENAYQFGKGNPNVTYRMPRQYRIMAGYTYRPEESNFALEPSAMFALSEAMQWTFDVHFKAYFMSNYWVGVSFRTMSNIVAMVGMRYKMLIVAYAYDYAILGPQQLGKWGSHEFMIGLRLADMASLGRSTNRF